MTVILIPSPFMTIGLLERELREICPKRDREDEMAHEENRQEVIDNNARTLIVRLSCSTARGPSREMTRTGSATRPVRTQI